MSDIKYTDYQVARGVLRIPSAITGMKDGSFSRDGEFLRPGDAIPEGMMSARECRALAASGIIRQIATPRQAQVAQEAASKHMSKWQIDPATLGNKSYEDLLVMIQGIDPQFPLEQVADEDVARRQLTRDFDPELRADPSPDVLGSDVVSRLTTEGVQDAGRGGGLSQRAAENLSELQARAQTAEASGDVDGESSDADAAGSFESEQGSAEGSGEGAGQESEQGADAQG